MKPDYSSHRLLKHVFGLGLQLDRVCSRHNCSVNNLKSPFKALFVITTHLSNHKRRMICTDGPAGDFDRHRALNSITTETGKRIGITLDSSAIWPQAETRRVENNVGSGW